MHTWFGTQGDIPSNMYGKADNTHAELGHLHSKGAVPWQDTVMPYLEGQQCSPCPVPLPGWTLSLSTHSQGQASWFPTLKSVKKQQQKNKQCRCFPHEEKPCSKARVSERQMSPSDKFLEIKPFSTHGRKTLSTSVHSSWHWLPPAQISLKKQHEAHCCPNPGKYLGSLLLFGPCELLFLSPFFQEPRQLPSFPLAPSCYKHKFQALRIRQ